MNELREIPLQLLRDTGENVRAHLGDVTEMAESLNALGVLQPILVTPEEEGFAIVAGHRRVAAAKAAGLPSVPAVVRDFDDEQRLEAMLIENLHRAALTPIDEARAYRALIERHGLTQRELAAKIGRSQSHISKRLARLNPRATSTEAWRDQVGGSVAAPAEIVQALLSADRDNGIRLTYEQARGCLKLIESGARAVQREVARQSRVGRAA